MLIGSAAHFKVCEICGDHGRIVFADGTTSAEMASRESALSLVEEALKEGKLHQIELPGLNDQIRSSGLVRDEADVTRVIISILACMLVCDSEGWKDLRNRYWPGKEAQPEQTAH